MNKEEIEEQLKLSKKQNKDKRYDYLCSEFNAINYCIKLEKYTNKLKQENQKYKEVIDKAIEYIENNSLYEEEYDYDYEENIYLSGVNDEIAKNDLLDILENK